MSFRILFEFTCCAREHRMYVCAIDEVSSKTVQCTCTHWREWEWFVFIYVQASKYNGSLEFMQIFYHSLMVVRKRVKERKKKRDRLDGIVIIIRIMCVVAYVFLPNIECHQHINNIKSSTSYWERRNE